MFWESLYANCLMSICSKQIKWIKTNELKKHEADPGSGDEDIWSPD